MTIAKPSPLSPSSSTSLSFEDYLQLTEGRDERYELIDGALVEMPPESIANLIKANRLLLALVQARVSIDLIFTGRCEVQVPVLQTGDAANRYPDLIVVDEAHLSLMEKRATITMQMPPPLLVAEVVSPGTIARERDYKSKRAQYETIAIPEYWIIDPEEQVVVIFELQSGVYLEVGRFSGEMAIASRLFPDVQCSAGHLLKTGK